MNGVANAVNKSGRGHWVPVLVFAVAFSIFFRAQLTSDLTLMFGNGTDGRFVIFIHEHVFRWFMGKDAFLSPPMFFNEPNTLGYSEALLLDQLFYAPLRLLGADMYLATSLTTVALSVLSFVCLYWLLRRFLTSVSIAATAAAIYTFSSNLLLSSTHLQHFASLYIPAIILCGVDAIQTLRSNPVRAVAAVSVGALLYGLLFSTSFYMAWFLSFDILLFVLIAALPARALVLDWIWLQPSRSLGLLIVGVTTLAVALIPFWLIYMPVFLSLGYRSTNEVLFWAPPLSDIINVGPDNLIWGPLVRAVTVPLDARPPNPAEYTLAITPTVQLLSLSAVAVGCFRKLWPSTEMGRSARACAIAGGLIPFVFFALVARWHDFSPFEWLYSVVPGAGAIRVAFRGMIVANLFAVAAVAVALDRGVVLLGAPDRLGGDAESHL